VGIRSARQQVGGAVGPKTATFRKKRPGRVEAFADDIAAHAVHGRVPAIVADQIPMLVLGTEAVFGPDKVIVETPGFEVREVIPLSQPHSYGFTPRDLLEYAGQLVCQRRFVRGPIADAEQLDGGSLRLLQALVVGNILKCAVKTDG